MTLPIAYFSGSWIESAQLCLPMDDLGCLQGVTVVERLRTFAGDVFCLDKHLLRLRRSLEIVGWKAESLCAEVNAAITEFVKRNAALLPEGNDWSITALITPGKTADAAQPTVCVHGQLPFELWAKQFEQGVEVAFSDIRQIPNNCLPPELKCRSRMHYYLADQQAAAANPAARALLLDQQGFVSEMSSANVVAFFPDRGLVAPRISGVLPGISLAVLLELADKLGIAHAEDDLRPEQFVAAQEAMLTSTSISVQPMVRVESRPIGDGKPGPIYRQLLAAWSASVDVDIATQARQFAR